MPHGKPNGQDFVARQGGEGFGFAEDEEEPARPLDPGMGLAVARRTVFRPDDLDDWGRVADRVAEGNCRLAPVDRAERMALRNAIATGALLTSGRHLQHGDANQPNRPGEVFTNCSTAAACFLKFYLLLNGSGVGRSYADDLMAVDWRWSPALALYLNQDHPDYAKLDGTLGEHPILPRQISGLSGVDYFRVPDSREGWAQALEVWEAMTHARRFAGRLVLDFSDIRPEGAPIAGMQGRPCSGPLSLMRGFLNAWRYVVEPARVLEMPQPWKQNLIIDHYFSAEVQVGGVRRSARMAVKPWTDPDVLDFIRIKESGGLWTANNSVLVDAQFWREVEEPDSRAHEIFLEATRSAYINGEPGWINADKLEDNAKGSRPALRAPQGSYRGYRIGPGQKLLDAVAHAAQTTPYPAIVNPCSEIVLSALGGYCTIADVAPALAQVDDRDEWDRRVLGAIRLAARFLIRVNTMDFLYQEEVGRTNRIGIGLTGVHEWAWLRFGLGFRELLDPVRAWEFWDFVEVMSQVAKEEANAYAAEMGLARPATVTTVKPSGSVSKLFGLTEGIHLPARRHYLRWVQFRGATEGGTWVASTDPQVLEYAGRGYPVRALETFQGAAIVGFPTEPLICRLGMNGELVTAPEATPEEQYEWLRLIEKHWLGAGQANQASYTLKVYTTQVGLEAFRAIVLANQPTIKCCSILPSKPDSEMGYEYLPEESLTEGEYRAIVGGIDLERHEEVSLESLQCANGACPI